MRLRYTLLTTLLCLFAITTANTVAASTPEQTQMTCTVGTSHATVQDALDDFACDIVQLTDTVYSGQFAYVPSGRTVVVEGTGGSTFDQGVNGFGFSVLTGGTATLRNVTLQRNNIGAHVQANASLTLDDVDFYNNVGWSARAGALVVDENGTAEVRDSIFFSNTVRFNGGAVSNAGLLTVHDTQFDSSAARGNAGTIHNEPTATLFLYDTTVSNSMSGAETPDGGTNNTFGGAIYNEGTAFIYDSLISRSESGTGGGISTRGFLAMYRSTVSSNEASAFFGGGIAAFDDADTNIFQSSIRNNQAFNAGGGIFQEAGSGGGASLLIENSTINFNLATNDGGGIWSGDSAIIRFSTIAENEAGWNNPSNTLKGSGLYVANNLGRAGATRVLGSIFANNYSNACRGERCAPSAVDGLDCHVETATATYFVSLGGNLVENGDTKCDSMLAASDQEVDPNFGPKQFAGNRQYYTLNNSSLAIDRVATANCPSNDLRGYARAFNFLNNGMPCDAGAYELGAVPTAVALGQVGVISAETTPIALFFTLLSTTGIYAVSRRLFS